MRRAFGFLAISILLATSVLLLMVDAAAQDSRITSTSRIPFPRVAAALERAIADQQMALVCHANAQRGAAARGVTIKGNQVMMVFRNDCAVYENLDGTATVSYVPPTVVFARYAHQEVQAVARELDPIFKAIVERGVAGR